MLWTCVCIWICVLLAFRLCHQNPRDAMLGHLYQSNPLTRHHHHPTSILGQRCPFLRSTHLWPHHLVQNVLFNLSVVCLFWLLVPPGENISCPGGKENNKSGQIQFSRLNVSTIQTIWMKIGKDRGSRILYKAEQWVGSKVVGWAVAGKIERGRVILTGVILLRGGGRTGRMKVLFRQGQKIRSLVFGTAPISGTMAPINWMFGSNWSHRWSTRRCPMPKVRGGDFVLSVVRLLPRWCSSSLLVVTSVVTSQLLLQPSDRWTLAKTFSRRTQSQSLSFSLLQLHSTS